MKTDDLMKVVRMTVYSGEYKKVRKSGYNNWVKVVMHCCPYAEDPIDGEKYVNHAIELAVPYWISDAAVEEIMAVATTKGQKFTDDKDKSSGFIIGESDVPRAYKYAFTELGMTLNWDRIEFNSKRVKVSSDGKSVKGSDGKPIKADSITVCYWTGGLADNSGVNLSKEMCVKRALSEWREVLLPVLEKEEKPAEEQHEGEESTGA